MNVMAEAHKQVRELLAVRPNIAYRVAFVLALVNAHKEYKAMNNTVKANAIKTACMADTAATDFVIEGTAVDSEGELIHIGFSTGNEGAAQKEAEYYLTQDNGFTRVNLYLTMCYVNKAKKSVKIVK